MDLWSEGATFLCSTFSSYFIILFFPIMECYSVYVKNALTHPDRTIFIHVAMKNVQNH
jgi:hypothetical protein